MILGSPSFEQAIHSPHEITLRCEALVRNRRVGPVSLPLAQDPGDWRVSKGTLARRSGTVRLADTREVRDILATPGVQLRVWRGIRGIGQQIPVLVGPIDRPRRGGSGVLEAQVTDAASMLGRDMFMTPRRSTRGLTTAQQIRQLWAETLPFVKWVDETQDGTAVPDVTWEESRTDAIQDLALSIGAETFLRPDFTVVLRPVASIRTRSVWTARGSTNLSSLDVASGVDILNDVAVIGEHPSGARYFGRFTDDTSPTGVPAIGRHGRKVRTASVTSNAQAVVMAQALVWESQGTRADVDYVAICHPGVEAGDVHTAWDGWSRHVIVVDDMSAGFTDPGMSVKGRTASLPMVLPEVSS